jgi:hypothetical protein
MSDYLGALNIVIAVALSFLPLIWVGALKIKGFNALTILILINIPLELSRLVFGPMYILPNPFQRGYQVALVFENIHQLITISLVYFWLKFNFTRVLSDKLCNQININYDRSQLKKTSIIFLLLSFGFFIALALSTGGILDWLSNIRDSYISKRNGFGWLYALSVNFLAVAYYSYGIFAQRIKYFLIGSICFFLYSLIYGSKGVIVQNLIYFLIVLSWHKKLGISKFIVLSSIVFMGIILFNFDGLNFSVLNYFDHLVNGGIFYEDRIFGNAKLFEGEIIGTSFWSYIPRALIPEKPYVYGILNVVEEYYPGGAESGNTPAFGGRVDLFADFGIVGFLFFSIFSISPLITALTLHIFFKHHNIGGNKIKAPIFFAGLILFGPSFGTFFDGPIFVILLITTLIIIKVGNNIKFNPIKYKKI